MILIKKHTQSPHKVNYLYVLKSFFKNQVVINYLPPRCGFFWTVNVANEKTTLFDAIASPDFWVFAGFFVAGTVTLALRKLQQPFNAFAFFGEVIIAIGIAFICWLFGLYHNMDQIQIALLALPSAYGQVHIVGRLIQAVRSANGSNQSGK